MPDGLAARAWRAATTVARQVAGGEVNARPQVTGGLTLMSMLRARADLTAGQVLVQRLSGVTAVVGALRLDPSATGTARPSVPGALLLGATGDLGRAGQPGALRITPLPVSFVGTRQGSGATGYTVAGRNDWATPGNVNGVPDGALATFAGSTLGARAGGVDVGLPAVPAKAGLTITQVLLEFHLRQTGTTLGNGTLKYGYRNSSGVRTQLAAPTSDVDGIASPLVHDITALIGGDWTRFGTVLAGAYAECSTASLNTSAAAWDAVTVRIRASE